MGCAASLSASRALDTLPFATSAPPVEAQATNIIIKASKGSDDGSHCDAEEGAPHAAACDQVFCDPARTTSQSMATGRGSQGMDPVEPAKPRPEAQVDVDAPPAQASDQAHEQDQLRCKPCKGAGESPTTTEEGSSLPPPATVHTQLLSEPKRAVDVTARGVTLSFLLRLAESSAVDPDWTIQELVDNYVRPSSRAAKTCLFDLVPPEHTGQPRYFISHTWSRKLSALLGMLREHFDEEGVLVWLDVIAINQHPYEDRGCLLNEDVANLSKVVRATEQTLFCLDVECVALTRIWCLYEVWQTFLAKGAAGFVVLMSAGVETTVLRDAFETFNISNAKATQEQDKDDILGKIKLSDVKATQINLQLKAALVDSATLAARAAGDATQPQLLARAAQMLDANGRYGEAEPMLRQALEARTRTLGEDHADTISSASNLAKCISNLGRPAEAEPMLRKVLDARKRLLGAAHQATLCSLSELAKCVSRQGRWADAEPMYQDSLLGRRALGAEHYTDAISSINDLAICLQKLGRHAEAEPMYRLALSETTRVLGPDNRQTIASASNLASYLSARGKHVEAEKMYIEALEAWERVLGPNHPSTISSLRSLAICINAQGRHTDAEPKFREALEMRTAALGPDNPSTITLRADLAYCIMDLGRYADAEPLYRQSFAARTRTLGTDHQDTISSLDQLARCVKKLEQYSEAEQLYLQLLATRTRVLGANHRTTGDAMHNLGLLLETMGQEEAAAALLSSAAEVYARAKEQGA